MFGIEFRPEDVVLDVGCGLGENVVAAGNAGARVVAIDIEPATVEHVRQRMQSVPARSFESYVSDCAPIPLPDETCTVVFAQEVLEHTTDPGSICAELVRVGQSGCRYLISVPSEESESVLRTVAPPEYSQFPNHVHVFSEKKLEELIAGSGLQITNRHYFGFYWSVWWLFKMAGEAAVPHWQAAWAEFSGNPRSAAAVELLDRLIPKSYVLVCVKPDKANKAEEPHNRVAHD